MTFLRVALCLSFVLVVGCGDDDQSADAAAPMDTGTLDAAADGVSADASLDAASLDAASLDAASLDAGPLDAAADQDAGGARDVGTDAQTPDAGGDAGTATPDAGTPVPDAAVPDVGVDSGSGCDRRVEDRVAGVCDGIGMQICTDWAAENGGGTAVSQCVPTDGRCARANTCTEGRCMCGSEEECGDTEMCVSGFAGFSCVCALPR